MPFLVIKGTFRLVNQTTSGKLTGFEPDGDSIHFKPDKPALLQKLKALVRPVKLSRIGSVQLRMEGLDALELHYSPDKGGKSSHQPRPLADDARDFLTGGLGLNPVPYAPPKLIRVKPPVEKDATPGFILARSLEVQGRPVSFVFAGDPPAPDGADIRLTPQQMRKSLNYQLLLSGNAYPLFYDTLFAELRNPMAAAVRKARRAKRGIWAHDKTQSGFAFKSQADLERDGVIVPKLFRRITDFLAESGSANLTKFLKWLEKKDEQVLDLDAMNFTHFDNVVSIADDKVRLTRFPEKIVFVSAK